MYRVGATEREVVRIGRRSAIVAVSLGALLGLAACTAGTGGGGSDSSSPATSSSSAPGSSSAGTSSAPAVAAAAAVIAITPASAASRVSPTAPVSVKITNGTLTSVKLLNPAGKDVAGAMASDGASWRSTEDLGYGKSYRLSATGRSGDGAPYTKNSTFSTVQPDNLTMPDISDVYGTALTKGGTYGVGMVVKVHFDEEVDKAKAERTLSVATTPKVTGGWYWSDDQNAYWRPQAYYAPGTKVAVSVKDYGVEVGKGLYGQADQSTSFVIGEKRVAIADAKSHHVKVYFSDKLVRNMPTSMGQGGVVSGKYGPIYLWTMPGTYTVINHENPAVMSSDSYGLSKNSPYGYAAEKVYWSTKISIDGIYLHELDTTVWAQGHQNVSHGCLNLNLSNAKWYYNHARVGDVVTVVHSGGPKLRFDQGGYWSVSWADWQKGSAL